MNDNILKPQDVRMYHDITKDLPTNATNNI